MQKKQHLHEHSDGTETNIHYWENKETGMKEGFKFKDDGPKSRFNNNNNQTDFS